MTEQKLPSLLQHPAQLLEMSQRLIANGQTGQAVTLAHSAIRHSGGTGVLQAIGKEILSRGIAGFHGPMLRDDMRNAAYAAGIVAFAPGRIALDIGTGTGLLAMLAARAGARHVYACELDQRLAITARAIIAANGLADRITILPIHSGKLDRDRDVAGGVDLVISEIFSDNLLGEGALPSLEDARNRLCLPGARFLPASAAIRVALVGSDLKGPAARFSPIGSVEGFDLSLLNQHISHRKRFVLNASDLELRSDAANLFAFDFADAHAATAETSIILQSRGGSVSGVAQWIQFETGAGHFYENAPNSGAEAHWRLMHYAFDEPIDTRPGQSVTVHAWRNEKTLLVWGD